jgi:hypothetical protein
MVATTGGPALAAIAAGRTAAKEQQRGREDE